MTRSLLTVLLVLSYAPIALADEIAGDVSVRQPLVRLVRPAEIEAACGVRGVAACTAFVGQRLDCDCEKSVGGWQIRAQAQFIPLMYLSDSTWASHERDHVSDVREALTAHLLRLELRLFESREACELESARETGGFGATMDRFKLESNSTRHPRFAKLMRTRLRSE